VIVSQQEDSALGMMTTALVSLSLPQPQPSLVIVDGASPNPPESGPLARLAASLPCPVRLAGTRQVAGVLAELTEEITRRQAAGTDGPPVFLAIMGLHRCRELRRVEDDYSYSRRAEDAPVPPQQLLADLLREGPPVGVHLLTWCDTLNNLQRAFDRQALREMGMRVAMQMSIADSSTLIDNPVASKLGMHRAIIASEEDGRAEKFRPYGPPPEAWLTEVKEATRAARAVAAPTDPRGGVIRIALSGSESPLQ
jgi:hypothetical protein